MDPTSYEENTSLTNTCAQDVNNALQDGLPEIPVEVMISKQKTSKATSEQKELMLEFIQENPEMVTHSSTVENERNLWEDLTEKLNILKPEKTQENWKAAWYRWQVSVFKRSETSLHCLDIKLKKFLTQLKSDCDGKMLVSQTKPKKKLNIEQIETILKDIEKEKYSLHLEIDENEISIQKFKSVVKHLENDNLIRHKRMKKLNERKMYLNTKRRKIQETEIENIEVLEKQLLDIDKQLAESDM
ncbi:uncharacterized protein LOC131672627 [Phymastichus coffea]|uniref:uncharacterized protein LOC131672627 n=1 Tax=Phymastichus coffea TaxID=108790 RepID=UPI00273C8095|nr:uncharacterized protein LOC131672627 [Phymastichus coffea]